MKPSKLFLAAVLTVGGIGALASCGGDDFNGLTINFWHTFGQTVAGGIESSAATFAKLVKENEGVDLRIKLTYKGGYDDVLGEVGKSFSAGGNPTITVAYPDHVADYFAAEENAGENYVVNLQPYAENATYGFGKEAWLGDKNGVDDFVESFFEESTNYAKDGMYSLPFLKSTEIMLYNIDLVQTALKIIEGGEPTVDDVNDYMKNLTWTEFMDFCQMIKEHMNEISPSLEVPAVYDSDGNLFVTQMYQQGIPYASLGTKTNSGIVDFDGRSEDASPEQKDAYNRTINFLKQYKQWFDKGYFTTKGVTGQYSSNYFAAASPKTMFAIGSCGGSGYSFPSSSEFKVGACKVPYNKNATYVSQGPTLALLHNKKLVNAGTDDQAVLYAWKFIKYLTNEDVNAAQCASNSEGYIPVRQSAYNTSAFTNFIKSDTDYVVVTKAVIEEVNGSYFSSPVFKGSAGLRKQCEGCFADVMKLRISKDATDEQIVNQIKTVLDRCISQAIIGM